jgi:hypothetical protein
LQSESHFNQGLAVVNRSNHLEVCFEHTFDDFPNAGVVIRD